MRAFYQSHDLLVTSDHVLIHGPEPAEYRIDFLEDVYRVEHPRNGRARPQYEIRAKYGVHDVRLFHTSDARIFGQVRRALIRALEWRHEERRRAGTNASARARRSPVERLPFGR